MAVFASRIEPGTQCRSFIARRLVERELGFPDHIVLFRFVSHHARDGCVVICADRNDAGIRGSAKKLQGVISGRKNLAGNFQGL